jgi:hypothetical protein
MTSDSRTNHRYTLLFCEENIWHLARDMVDAGAHPSTLQVIFISNSNRQVVLFKQRSAGEGGYVVWDYHVVLRRRDATGDRIYDFDSTLPFPCDTHQYLTTTFGNQIAILKGLRASLRLICATAYLHHFTSDRSHMQGAVPEAAFPPWPAILPRHGQVIRLDEYWEMEGELIDGSEVYSVEALLEQTGRNHTINGE